MQTETSSKDEFGYGNDNCPSFFNAIVPYVASPSG